MKASRVDDGSVSITSRADSPTPPIVNPTANGHPGDADVAVDTAYGQSGGYFYHTSESVVRRWAAANGCDGASEGNGNATGCTAGSAACALGEANGAACEGFTKGCDGGSVVVGCLHPGGHEVPAWAPDALWAFMRAHTGGAVLSPKGATTAEGELGGRIRLVRART